MRWNAKPAPALLLIGALCATASACSPSARAVRPLIPPLGAAVAEPCRDPGVDEDVDVALIQNRRAWAVCAEKHGAAVAAYDDIRGEIEATR